MNILGKRSDLLFSRKSDRKEEKSTVSLTHVQNIICSQTHLEGIANEQTIICNCRQLLAGHEVGSRSMKRKKNLLRMIVDHIRFDCFVAQIKILYLYSRHQSASKLKFILLPYILCFQQPINQSINNLFTHVNV